MTRHLAATPRRPDAGLRASIATLERHVAAAADLRLSYPLPWAERAASPPPPTPRPQ